MWRILGTISKGFRQIVGNSCHRQKSDECHAANSLRPLVPKFLSCNFSCKNSSSITAEKPTPAGEEEFKESKGKSQERKEHEFRSRFNTAANQHSFFEALGWGTAIILGWQVCKPLQCSERRVNESSNGKRKCFFRHFITRFATAQPLYSNSVLPQQQISRRNDTDESLDEYSSLTTSLSVAESTNAGVYGPPTAEQALTEARNELMDVHNIYIAEVENQLGIQHIERHEDKKAFDLFSRASKLGSVKAVFNLGICHEKGLGTAQNLKLAAHCYKRASRLGHATATYNLAVFYLNGLGGLKVNIEKSRSLLLQAASYGQADAVLALQQWDSNSSSGESSIDYSSVSVSPDFYGDSEWGVKNDSQHAVEQYSRDALRGHPSALHSLAECYETGISGVPQEPHFAMELYGMAAEKGHDKAADKLKELQVYDAIGYLQDLGKDKQVDIHHSASSPTLSGHWEKTGVLLSLSRSMSSLSTSCDSSEGYGSRESPQSSIEEPSSPHFFLLSD